MPFTIQGPQLEIADGTYPAVLESVTTEPSKTPTIPGDVRRWSFLVEHDGKVEPMDALSSTGTGPKTKSYAWLTALIQRPGKRSRIRQAQGACFRSRTMRRAFPRWRLCCPMQSHSRRLRVYRVR